MDFESEEDFIDYLADQCEQCDRAVKKLRNALRALKATRNRTLVDQLYEAEENANELVQGTLAMIKKAPSNAALSNINDNEEYQEYKAAFKKTVRGLNICTQDIQQGNFDVVYESGSSAQIQTQDAPEDEEDRPVDPDNLQLDMVINSQIDVEKEIEAENRDDAMKLAQDTVVLRDMMADTVEMIEEQGEQLNEVDQTMEVAAETTESAVKELTAAREHQKSVQKIKVIIGAVCGCLVLTTIILLSLHFTGNLDNSNSGSSTPDTPGTGSMTTTAAPVPPNNNNNNNNNRMLREVASSGDGDERSVMQRVFDSVYVGLREAGYAVLNEWR